MRTYEVEVHRTMSIKVKSQKKAEAERVAKMIWYLLTITSHAIRKTGIFGQTESEHMSTIIGGRFELPDPVVYAKECEAFLASLPEVILEPDAVWGEARRLFLKHMHVDDTRITPQQAAEEAAKHAEIEAELKERNRKDDMEFIAEWGLPEKVKIPEGMMAVYLSLTHDDSDAMSDYYNRHCTVGKSLLLAIVPTQAQTERLARSVVERYQSLAKHVFKWHTENYSMGHGNYLMSGVTEHNVRKNSYRNDTVAVAFEIRFNKYAGGSEMYPYKEYRPSFTSSSSDSVETSATPSVAVTMRLNDARQGVELIFDGRPGDDVLSLLHSARFRWSRRQRLWYAKQSPRALEVARHLSGNENQTDSTHEESLATPDESVAASLSDHFTGPITGEPIEVATADVEAFHVEQTASVSPSSLPLPPPAVDCVQQSLFS